MNYNGFENPKQAAIRLLRSQGCCPDAQEPKPRHNPNLQNLLRYKEQLEHKVVRQKAKLQEIPCVLELGQQIEQLQQVIEGLSRQNKQRIKHIKRSYHQSASTSTGWQDEEQQKIQHKRLQTEYDDLMEKLRKINDRNIRLVSQLK